MMSCYEQFSLSSEIDGFFNKIIALPKHLRDYAFDLIKERVNDCCIFKEATEVICISDDEVIVDPPEAVNDPLDIDSNSLNEENFAEIPKISSKEKENQLIIPDNLQSNFNNCVILPNATSTPIVLNNGNKLDGGFLLKTKIVREEGKPDKFVILPPDSESPISSKAPILKKVVQNGRILMCLDTKSKKVELSQTSSHSKLICVKTSDSKVTNASESSGTIQIENFYSLKDKSVVGSTKKPPQNYILMKSGKNFVKVPQIKLDPLKNSAQSPVKSLKSGKYFSKPNILRSHEKELISSLPVSKELEPKTFSSNQTSHPVKVKLNQKKSTNVVIPSKKPKLDVAVGSNDQVILRNTSTCPIAFVADQNIVVQKSTTEDDQCSPNVEDSSKTNLSFPIAFLSNDKVIIQGDIGVDLKAPKDKIIIKAVGSKDSESKTEETSSQESPVNADSISSNTEANVIPLKYRHILPKSQTQIIFGKKNVLKEMKVVPFQPDKSVLKQNSAVVVKVSNEVSNKINIKRKGTNQDKKNLGVKKFSPIKTIVLNKDRSTLTKPANPHKRFRFNSKSLKLVTTPKKVKLSSLTSSQESWKIKLSEIVKKEKLKTDKRANGDSDDEVIVVIDKDDVIKPDEKNANGTNVVPKKIVSEIMCRNGICEKCGKSFSTLSSLKRHLETHVRKQKCLKCPFVTYSRKEFSEHLQKHKETEIFKCEFCDKEFSRFVQLKGHIMEEHYLEKQYKCSKCDYQAHTQRTLTSHFRYKHLSKMKHQFVCPVCNKIYKQSSELRNHVTIHLPEKIFKCDICDGSFALRTTLRSHMRNVHGERRYACPICPLTLKTRDNLKRHLASHTDTKLFYCPHCEYGCNSQGNVVKHVRTKHNIEGFSLRKIKRRQEVDLESATHDGLRRGEFIANAYLSHLSRKLGRKVVVKDVEQKETNESVETLIKSVTQESEKENVVIENADLELSDAPNISRIELEKSVESNEKILEQKKDIVSLRSVIPDPDKGNNPLEALFDINIAPETSDFLNEPNRKLIPSCESNVNLLDCEAFSNSKNSFISSPKNSSYFPLPRTEDQQMLPSDTQKLLDDLIQEASSCNMFG